MSFVSLDTEKERRLLENRARREKLARLTAEDLLEKKSLELFEANQRLAVLNENLEGRVNERTRELERERQRALVLAEKDYLTGLANRHCFTKKFEEAVAEASCAGKAFALILIDLDGFKELNDTFGHAAGDAMLKTAAKRLAEVVRSTDLIARLGGDEFAIIAFDIADEQSLALVTDRLLAALQSPVKFGKRRIQCGASLGVAFCPEHSKDTPELQLFADLALYRAKAGGRGIAVSFEPKMAESHFLRFAMGDELKAALKNNEIRVFFQPVHDLKDRSTKGAEALVRWNNPIRGWIPPLDILAIAGDQELLPTLTRHIIRESLVQSKDLIERRIIDWVSINLTGHDLRDRALIDFILDTLAACKVAPHSVKFEVTEHTVISDAENACDVITQLSRMGVRFAIDDFGTGYSNLMTLNRLPFHILKVDQSFVVDLASSSEAQTIVKAMIDLGHALDMSIIAEGIETPQQAETLRALGCDLGQGYFFGRPLPVDEIVLFHSA